MNQFEKRNMQGGNVVWIVVVVALIVFGFLLFKGWDRVVNSEIDNMTTVTGSFSCLPMKDGTIDQTNCQLGVRASDGVYYALDISRIQDANTDLKAEDTIAVTGYMQPIEAISSPEWNEFMVAGIIKVNTLLRTR